MWRRSRGLLRFQAALDVGLVVIFGPALFVGGDLNPVRCLERNRPFTDTRWSGVTAFQPTQSDLVLQFHPWWEAAREQTTGRAPAADRRRHRRRSASAGQRPDRVVGAGDVAGVGPRPGARDDGDGAVEDRTGRSRSLFAVVAGLAAAVGGGSGRRHRLRGRRLPGGVVTGAPDLGHRRPAVVVVAGLGGAAAPLGVARRRLSRCGVRMAAGQRTAPGDCGRRHRFGAPGRSRPPPAAVAAGGRGGGVDGAGGPDTGVAHRGLHRRLLPARGGARPAAQCRAGAGRLAGACRPAADSAPGQRPPRSGRLAGALSICPCCHRGRRSGSGVVGGGIGSASLSGPPVVGPRLSRGCGRSLFAAAAPRLVIGACPAFGSDDAAPLCGARTLGSGCMCRVVVRRCAQWASKRHRLAMVAGGAAGRSYGPVQALAAGAD